MLGLVSRETSEASLDFGDRRLELRIRVLPQFHESLIVLHCIRTVATRLVKLAKAAESPVEGPGVHKRATQARRLDEVLERSNRGISHPGSIEREPDARLDARETFGRLGRQLVGRTAERQRLPREVVAPQGQRTPLQHRGWVDSAVAAPGHSSLDRRQR